MNLRLEKIKLKHTASDSETTYNTYPEEHESKNTSFKYMNSYGKLSVSRA